MRNNSGVLKNQNGTHVRYGLGNDSSQTNKVFKSSYLIGITPITCRCGQTYGVFTACEIKKPGWVLRHSDTTAAAQQNFITTIRKKHGLAGFVQSQEDLYNVYKD